MAKSTTKTTIQLDEDLNLQSLFWKTQRFGWIIFAFILAAAFLGFTGTGPLNNTTAENQSLRISYHPFARQLTATDLTIQIKNLQKDQASFWIDQDFLNKYQIQGITPEPDEVTIDGTKLQYQFKQRSTPVEITLHLQPQQFSFIQGKIGQANEELTVRQFVYP